MKYHCKILILHYIFLRVDLGKLIRHFFAPLFIFLQFAFIGILGGGRELVCCEFFSDWREDIKIWSAYIKNDTR